MSKKTYIITAVCVFAVAILGCLVYLLANADERKTKKDLQELVSEFNTDAKLVNHHRCIESRTVYEPQSNVVSIDYYFTPAGYDVEQFDMLDDHPNYKEMVTEELEKSVIGNANFTPILKAIVAAKATLRVRLVDKERHRSAIIKWRPSELKRLYQGDKR